MRTRGVQAVKPVSHGALVPRWHVQAWQLSESEQAGSLVLCTDDRWPVTSDVTAIGNDYDGTVLADVVLPAVQDRARGYLPSGFLADLPDDALLRILPELQLSARKLPLGALVLQQQHPPVLNGNALQRYGERGPAPGRGELGHRLPILL